MFRSISAVCLRVVTGKGLPHTLYLDGELLPWTQALWQDDGEPLLPGELQGVGTLIRKELKWHDAHSHQLVLVQLLKALSDDRTYSLSKTKKEVNGKKQAQHQAKLTVEKLGQLKGPCVCLCVGHFTSRYGPLATQSLEFPEP